MGRMSGLGLFALLAAGCGQSNIVPVEGTILVDGQPGKNLFVQFEPLAAEGKQFPGLGSIGRTDASGVYRLVTVPDKRPGAVIAKHAVRIFVETKRPSTDETVTAPREPLPPALKQLPARYNYQTELTFDVTREGANRADFSLTMK